MCYVQLIIRYDHMRLLIDISRTSVSWGQINIDLVTFLCLLLYAVKRHTFVNTSDHIWKVLKQMKLDKLTIPGLDPTPEG